MSSTYISVAPRDEVETRAKSRCEYCLLHADDAYFAHHVDHVIAEKHGGQTDADKLALCCAECNLHKGSDLASLTSSGRLVALSTRAANVGARTSVLMAAKLCL